ncbi:MAG: Coenzyme F420 hydrogenase/dehydrogenase, beta subunit C-terminal domain [Candidatus Lokiarchaeota archaeon]
MSLEGNITWNFLRDLADALKSYKIRALIDAKNEILNSGIYNESQYNKILFSLIKEEKQKFMLFNFLINTKNVNLKVLREYSKDNSLSLRKIFTYLELLNVEKLISFDKKYKENKTSNDDDQPEKILDGINIKVKFENFDHHKTIYEPVKVIFNEQICSGCGLCSGICPVDCINIENGFGKINSDICIRCGLCYFVCPRSFLPVDLLNLHQSDSEVYQSMDKIGSYIAIYGARTKVEEIKKRCQDGGITSTCLYYLFKNSKIDYALGAKIGEKLWCPEPSRIRGKNLAVVGVPCQMQALLKSKIYDIGIPSINTILYRIGIFCMESFPYEEGFKKICEKLNVQVTDVKKTDINKGKFFVYTKNGDELNIPIKDISNLARIDCEFCFDLTSESADVSIGSIGVPSGWNCVILRTEKGKELYKTLIEEDLIESKPIESVKPGLPLLKKVARSKRSKCNKHIESRKEENKRIPLY